MQKTTQKANVQETSASAVVEPLMSLEEVQKASDSSVPDLYRAMSEGRFPLPIKTGKSRVSWLVRDVVAWQQERIRERDERAAAKAEARAKAENAA
jgi:predicted DNA-binding transcriptional regulator AlpA